MRPFDYHPAANVAEALDLAARYGEDAQFLAGGTSVMLLGRLGLAEPEHVVGLHGVGELRGVDVDIDGRLRLGALTTLAELATDPRVRQQVPALAEAAGHVATVRIRHQATLGGTLAHADPAQDVPPMLVALDASVIAQGAQGERQLPVEELFAGYLETSLQPGELITAVTVPETHGARGGYAKFLPRTEDDYATVSAAAVIELDGDEILRARVALGAVGPVPVRARTVEQALAGRRVSPSLLRDAADLVRSEVDPIEDARGSADYKTEMAGVWLRRLLERLTMPGGEGGDGQ